MKISMLGSLILASFGRAASVEASRTPVGNSRLEATASIINENLAITLSRAPNARFILAGDVSPGPRNTNFGPICLGLTNRLRIFNDSIRGAGARLDGAGQFVLMQQIPNQMNFIGFRFYLQGFVRDLAAPMGLAHSNGLTLVVSNHGLNLASPGSLQEARALHTATLLDADRILVAGGGSGSLLAPVGSATAEIYNVHTKDSLATGSMGVARAVHTATLLMDGRVLVTGGVDAVGNVLSSAEIYDPATGVWAPTGSMSTPRWGHTAALLGDGRVMVAGGTTTTSDFASIFNGISNTAEIFDPTGSTFGPAASTMGSKRLAHQATPLQNGDVLLTGGFDGLNILGLPTLAVIGEVFHPTGNNFNRTSGGQSVGNLRTARAVHSATLLPDGRVLLAGGAAGLTVNSTSNAEIYSPSNGSFANTGSLLEAKAAHTAVVLASSEVLVSGGFSGNLSAPTATSSCQLFSGASWTVSGALNTARGAHTATRLPNGTVLVLGGADDVGALFSGEIYSR